MASPRPTVVAFPEADKWTMTRAASFPRFRVLAWDGDLLYASHAYTLLCAKMNAPSIQWEIVGYFRPAWWRNFTVTSRLSFRLFRDGFHALAVLPSGHFVAAVPGAIISLAPGETEFRISHDLQRGTRPLHITAAPDKRLFWGEYFDNPQRDEVHIYTSEDRGMTWDVAYTFAKGAIRHVHNIVYDEFENCLWILTGDNGAECRILRASCDLKDVEVVLSGNQQARAVALVPMKNALYFSSDTPVETNHVYRLERAGNLTKLAGLSSSSIYGCKVGESIFFSTMAEPSAVNSENDVMLLGSHEGQTWRQVLKWKKDLWTMGLFQYGNVLLPDGKNTTGLLALTTVAVEQADLETTIWRM
jgi:hypothetical protein